MKQVSIYGLYDPRNPALIMYVGQALHMHRRLAGHLRDKSSIRKARWVAQLEAEGHTPEIVELESVLQAEADAAECRLIAHWRVINKSLLNIADGAGGLPLQDVSADRQRVARLLWAQEGYRKKMCKPRRKRVRIGPQFEDGRFISEPFIGPRLENQSFISAYALVGPRMKDGRFLDHNHRKWRQSA